MDQIPQSLSYVIIALLTVTESATVMFAAGFAAHKEWIEIVPGVLMAGFTGSFVGTQALFYFGRRKGADFFAKRPKWEKTLAPASTWLRRHQILATVLIRFVPGVRLAAHIALGMTDITSGRFTVFNALGAAIWASVLSYVAYYSGAILDEIAKLLGILDWHVIAAIVTAGLLYCFCFLLYQHVKYQRAAAPHS